MASIDRFEHMTYEAEVNYDNSNPQIKLSFSVPCSKLYPNRKNGKHWGFTAQAKKIAREQAFALTKGHAPVKLFFPNDKIHCRIDYIPPDRRKRDTDNIIGALKYTQDGIFKALGVDDDNIKAQLFVKHEMDKLKSGVYYTISLYEEE